MTSFTLRETINHFIERGSKTYCCTLDASSAFDSVWIDRLFYCVFLDGVISPWFSVLQSVRQGGVLSAWLYTLFMNELPDTLKARKLRGPFHKSSYERFLLYEFVEPVLNYRSNEFVALTNLC